MNARFGVKRWQSNGRRTDVTYRFTLFSSLHCS